MSEPLAMWPEYLDPELRPYAPRMRVVDTPQAMAQRVAELGARAAVPLLPELTVDGRPLFANWGLEFQLEASRQSQQHRRSIDSATRGAGQLAAMDTAGISEAYLFPTLATFLVHHEELPAPVSAGFARAYNRWLLDYCAEAPARLHPVGMVSRHDPAMTLAELDRIIGDGFRCVVMRPEPIRGLGLGDPRLEPFWTRCEQESIAVAIHGSTHLFGPTVGRDRFTTRFALHACSHPMEAQLAFLALLDAGVLERHPRLKVAFLEAGASWVPHWLWRLDAICYATMPGENARNVTMKPSAYFARQCWVGIELEEPCLRQVIDCIGADRLLYGTDFPHPDHLPSEGDARAERDERDGGTVLTEREQELVFRDNARAFFEGAG
ncbi:amidohydrolase family protein [Pendulispora albinea]|uniref:Amidohydrolase n=1 Tax=Pendulispora albinea TaxID=2741071 RepID=A0ABZ2M7C3_9BACT